MTGGFSVFVIPLAVVSVVLAGTVKGLPVFELFTEGAKDGIKTSVKILPSLVGLLAAVSMLRASGFFDAAAHFVSPFTDALGFPKELVPLALIRPVSGSASLAFVRDILENYGPDSFVGKCASVIMGSTETTFYTLAVYFGSVGVKKSRYTVGAALLADLTGMITGVLAVRLLMC